MARHRAPGTPVVRRSMAVRSMAVLATAGAALGVGAAASAAQAQVLPDDAGQVVGTVADL